MKLLLRLLLLMVMSSAYAQSNLPACQGNEVFGWNSCQGTRTYPNGDQYIGEWKNGVYHGQGAFTSIAGHKYVGEYRDGRMHGQGTFTSIDGDKYVGEYRDGRAHGQGTRTFANGDKYVGEYRDSLFHGQGTRYTVNGAIINQGFWEYGKFIRAAQIQQINTSQNNLLSPSQNYETRTLNDGTFEQGIFKKNCPIWGNWCATVIQGNGKRVYPSGEIEEGYFDNGQLTGKGKVIKSTKEIIEGDFKNGLANGLVIVTDRSGKKKTAVYSNGIETDVRPAQQLATPNTELEKLRADNEEAKRKQAELEQQLRLAQNQPQANVPQANQPPPTINQGRRVALVIGNASYSSVPKLINPTNDAREVTRALQATGFEVIRLENADLRQMQDAVRSFGNRLGKNDVGLFYFSGHGVQVKGKNYLIPVRENIKQSFEVPSGAVDADLVLATMENAKNNLNIMILDACRSPFPGEARSLSRGLATLDAAKGTLIAYATAPGKEALDGQGNNSPYTKHLVRALQQKGLPIEQVFKQVRIAVVEETKGNQVPWENSSIMGDFYFRK
jgi:hypothetical protein